MAADEKSFFERWSQRKQAAREQPTQNPEPPREASPACQQSDTPKDEKTPAEGTPPLPPIENLTADSDYTVFMREGVPEELRQRALRKLWLTDTIFTAPDVLDIYALDYANAPSFPAGVKTLFQVGVGMVDQNEPSEQAGAARQLSQEGPDAVAGDATLDGDRETESQPAKTENQDTGPEAEDENKPV